MADEIVNRIAKSTLQNIDLEEFYPKGNRIVLDIKPWLYEELIVKENDFRDHLKSHDWSQYDNSYVVLQCSSDAIIPSWVYLLITTYLGGVAKKVVVGDLGILETVLFQEIIENLDVSPYKGKPVIIKGCSDKPIPDSAYVHLIEKLKPVAKSIMFGEACSTVPLFKNK